MILQLIHLLILHSYTLPSDCPVCYTHMNTQRCNTSFAFLLHFPLYSFLCALVLRLYITLSFISPHPSLLCVAESSV
jgi:hypothetical protein